MNNYIRMIFISFFLFSTMVEGKRFKWLPRINCSNEKKCAGNEKGNVFHSTIIKTVNTVWYRGATLSIACVYFILCLDDFPFFRQIHSFCSFFFSFFYWSFATSKSFPHILLEASTYQFYLCNRENLLDITQHF